MNIVKINLAFIIGLVFFPLMAAEKETYNFAMDKNHPDYVKLLKDNPQLEEIFASLAAIKSDFLMGNRNMISEEVDTSDFEMRPHCSLMERLSPLDSDAKKRSEEGQNAATPVEDIPVFLPSNFHGAEPTTMKDSKNITVGLPNVADPAQTKPALSESDQKAVQERRTVRERIGLLLENLHSNIHIKTQLKASNEERFGEPIVAYFKAQWIATNVKDVPESEFEEVD